MSYIVMAMLPTPGQPLQVATLCHRCGWLKVTDLQPGHAPAGCPENCPPTDMWDNLDGGLIVLGCFDPAAINKALVNHVPDPVIQRVIRIIYGTEPTL